MICSAVPAALLGALAAPVARGEFQSGYGWALVKVLLSLVLVSVAVVLLLRLMRRYLRGDGGGGGALEVVERLPLAPRQAVWLVRVGTRWLLLGATDQAVTRLAELRPEDLPELDLSTAPSPQAAGQARASAASSASGGDRGAGQRATDAPDAAQDGADQTSQREPGARGRVP